jgi:hypothetical protein
MTLKEKFKEILTAFWTSEWESECEKVADEFAIGFGEYIDSLTAEDMGTLSIKELLEIYKKEKGL